MHAERWQRVEALVEEASARPPAEREGYLRRACGDDAALLHEVSSLVRELEADPGFMEQPIVPRPVGDASGAATGEVDGEGDALPPTIGQCRVVRRLGRGGMGEVYLGSRVVGGVAQDVAVKVIRRGMDSDEVLRRFRLELKILATLRHPNIAAMLDAGATDDGRPYVVMEYVDGVPITEHCDARALSIAGRLRLLQAVGAAVTHAHQRLVVHRDLKPGNILVTAEGVPKLLDFGIGKVLSPGEAGLSAVETRAEYRLLTPEYAAPEQITAGTITTATDVFSLGVVVYEVLTGEHPFREARRRGGDLAAAAREAVAARPSECVSRGDASVVARRAARRGMRPEALRRALSGDLDTILLTALRPEPERRYPSVAAFMEDLQRHLEARPVRARPDTLGYRARQFVRRNTAGVVAGTALAVALVSTTAVTIVQSRRVAREAARAERERDQALEVRGFLLELFGASGADQAVGDTVTARALLDRQVAQVDVAYRDRPALMADMLEVLADGYDRLGLYAQAEPLAQRALDLRRERLGAAHPDVASSLTLLGWIRHERGASREAEPLLLEAARIRREGGTRLRRDLSRTLNDLGVTYNATRRWGDAEAVLREALAIRRAEFGDGHRAVGITANNLAAALYFQQQVDSAIVVQALAVQALERSVGPDHQRSVVALGNLAAFKRVKGDLAAAERDYRMLAERQARLQGSEHPVTARVIESLATILSDRGQAEGNQAALAEADTLFRQALAAFERRLGVAHPQVGETLNRWGTLLARRARTDEARAAYERALPILVRAHGDTSRVVARVRANLGALKR